MTFRRARLGEPGYPDMKINGVFEGGGVRGVALAGAAAAALDAGLEFDRAVGTSAGALVASLLVAGYGPDEMAGTLCHVDWAGLLRPVPAARIPGIGRHLALLTRKGWFHSGRLEEVWGELLAARGVRTFGDIRPGSLGVVVTDLSHARGVLMPDGLRDYGYDPDSFPVARALRMSAALPFFFTPVTMRDRLSAEDVLMADGAMAANYPVSVVGRNHPVIGFRLVASDDRHDHHTVRGPLTLARSVVIAGVRARYALPRLIDRGAHVIEVPVDADLDFEMSARQARMVFERGRRAAATQLQPILSDLLSSAA